jgi:cobalamin biosynthesis Mg chelatase CobN
LESEAVAAAKASQAFDEPDVDATIMSRPGDLAAEARTVAVTQAQVEAALEGRGEQTSAPEPEAEPESPQTAPVGAGGDFGATAAGGSADNSNRRMWIIIGVVALLVLCCCCCSIAIGVSLRSNPEILENILGEVGVLPSTLTLFV